MASEQPLTNKRCFVISAFGSTVEERTRTKQVLRHLVRKVLEPLGYSVVRADELDDEGLITHQIIEHLLEDELVVADLSGHNPNVFYELAVRHAARKPVVHLITRGEQIPFDVANVRCVLYALDDPDLLEDAQAELERKVAAIESSAADAPNPISSARDVWLLRESDSPETREFGEVLAAVSEIRDELRTLRVRRPDPPPRQPQQARLLRAALDVVCDSESPVRMRDLADQLGVSSIVASRLAKELMDLGWVDTGSAADDPRARVLVPTASGRSLSEIG